jgi:hypothetical protein
LTITKLQDALIGSVCGRHLVRGLGDYPVFVFAELFGNAGDRGDVTDLVDVCGHAEGFDGKRAQMLFVTARKGP